MHPRLEALARLGQSLWYDYLSRDLVQSGELARLVEMGVRGVTSNPTIFDNAIAHGEVYDPALAALVRAGQRVDAIYDALTMEDVQAAAEVLRPVYEATGGQDGFVSLEVSPLIATDTAATVREGERLFHTLGRPNVMIKVPATPEGLPAIRALVRAGVHVNVTLIFGLAQYRQVVEAFLAGLEDRLAEGLPLDRLASVASFFVSRVDTWVDRWLADHGKPAEWAGQAAVAQAKVAYHAYQEIFASARFQRLAARGAMPQRLLWASTGTKNPAYPDIKYVAELIGPQTVNTVPPATLRAWLDHGQAAPTLEREVDQARAWLERLAAAGCDLDQVAKTLLGQGVEAFTASFLSLRRNLATRRAQLVEQWHPVRYALGEQLAAVADKARALESAGAVERIWNRDGGFWSEQAAVAAQVEQMLGWLTVPAWSREQLSRLKAFAQAVWAEGFTHAVVLGMGGSSLVTEVLRHAYPAVAGRCRLHVLDSTHPQAVGGLLARVPLARTLFLVASKSGTTTEVEAFSAACWQALAASGRDPAGQFVAITDPGTPLAQKARERGYRAVWENPPDIGGRYSALSLFGLVPAALAGIDVESLLDRAAAMQEGCRRRTVAENPGAYLGTILGTLARLGRDKVTVAVPARIGYLADWIEQLLAESTGKQGTGLVPVVHEPLAPAEAYGTDRVFVVYRWYGAADAAVERWAEELERAGHPLVTITLADRDSLGAEFFRWEFATAVAGHILRVNPFDQPDVQAAKTQTARILEAGAPDLPGRAVGDRWLAVGGPAADDPVNALKAWLDGLEPGAYLAILAYLEPTADHWDRLQALRQVILTRWRRPTTLGFGPRYLHSTGQLHKGGTSRVACWQLVSEDYPSRPVAGPAGDFSRLIRAQADGDYLALAERGRRVARWVLSEPAVPALDRLRQWLEAGPRR